MTDGARTDGAAVGEATVGEATVGEATAPAAAVEDRPVVTTDRGRVRGVVEGAVAAFRGIPYAASPVGKLRFAPPRPHEGWSETRDAARSGPSVPQNASRLEAVMGKRVPNWAEADSLNLNVWTPARLLSESERDGRRPVLLWFHGGGFTSGSGGWDWYDGGRLAALGDIVVVTANYRLGPLGYLHLPEPGTDNVGVRDQAAVLRWVHANAEAFGGDPGAITVGGQSAGAYASLALALVPETRPLIRRVIAQSGPWGMEPQDPDKARDHTAALVRLLGVDSAPNPGDALRELPVERLLAAYAQLSADLAVSGHIDPPLFPVLGGAGMPSSPLPQAVANGDLGETGLLIGTVKDEMTAFVGAGPHAQPLTDTVMRTPTLEIAAARAEQGAPPYVYEFDRESPDNSGLGATHCSELPFLFGTFDAFAASPMLGHPTPSDRTLSTAFASAFAAFVATGSPTGEGLAPWEAYGTGEGDGVKRFG
ncbi:carboxylesterase/lipase family protein [Streptomyces varsoviensis]|uniref:carboxylesterase/lipase family protein n=1 Tax=Streptomyces varsoviensis TaxID=67373 RepID=UPI000996FF81|nr:carboxylesterase family protein [Streptomyces varsoviensis]